MIEIKTQINDDDEDRGIAGAFGVDAETAAEHEAAVCRDDVISDEGKYAKQGEWDIYAGIGMFYVCDAEDALAEAVIAIVAEMGCVFSLEDLDDAPSIDDTSSEWYREFADDAGTVLATLAVGYDIESGLYRMAVVNEEKHAMFSVTGLNGPADAVWLLSDLFRFSQV